MNNEPVAWIIDASMTDCDDNFIWNTGNYPDWQVKDWIPLYTHPVNLYQSITDTEIEPTVVSYTHPAELTDKEMKEIAMKHQGVWDEDTFLCLDYRSFAREILRKAQEK
jgi:hypothetical protein